MMHSLEIDFANVKDDDKQVTFESLEVHSCFMRMDTMHLHVKVDATHSFNLESIYLSSCHPNTPCLPVRIAATVDFI